MSATLTDDQAEVVEITTVPIDVPTLLLKMGMAPSKNQARRLIEQGAVEISEEKIIGITYEAYLRVGEENKLHVRCGKQQKIAVFSAENIATIVSIKKGIA